MAPSRRGANAKRNVEAIATMSRTWRRVAAAVRRARSRSALPAANSPVATAGETMPTIEAICHAAPKAAAWTGRPAPASIRGRSIGGV